ncbi:MAG: S1 RNA-binding domain-containing protein, partial [Slackia sp.]|nr:S1 RNA-binding domain-containing protein [Slackia sp.]
AVDQAAGRAARAAIEAIVKEPEVGEVYEGAVVGIQSFGAFVKLTPSKDGLLHISRVANGRVGQVEDVLNVGDVVKVEVIEIDPKSGKISLDRLDKPDAPEGSAPAREPRGEGRDGREGRRERADRRPGRANREAASGEHRTPRRRH